MILSLCIVVSCIRSFDLFLILLYIYVCNIHRIYHSIFWNNVRINVHYLSISRVVAANHALVLISPGSEAFLELRFVQKAQKWFQLVDQLANFKWIVKLVLTHPYRDCTLIALIMMCSMTFNFLFQQSFYSYVQN